MPVDAFLLQADPLTQYVAYQRLVELCLCGRKPPECRAGGPVLDAH